MTRAIKKDDVVYRKPYSLQCNICLMELEGDTAESVVQQAKEKGWGYDDEIRLICCGECRVNFME